MKKKENHQGFDNPAYAYLLNLNENSTTSIHKRSHHQHFHSNYLNNLIDTFEAYGHSDYSTLTSSSSSSSSVMNIYEDILDLNHQKVDEHNDKPVLSSSSSILSSSSNLTQKLGQPSKTKDHFKNWFEQMNFYF